MTRFLFIGAITCFSTVLWIALAGARRIRRTQPAANKPGRRHSTAGIRHAQEFFEAGEFRTPRPLRLYQELPQRPLSEISFSTKEQGRNRQSSDPSVPSRPFTLFGITSAPAPLSQLHAVPKSTSPQHQSVGLRKPPRSVAPSAIRRLDISAYNEVNGDLTDPYTQSAHDPQPARRSAAPGWLPRSG